MTDERCPDCNEPLEYDEVDIGVGVQRGNYYCPNCGWSPKAPDVDDEPCLPDGTPLYPRRKLTREERLQGLADNGCDTWEEYRGER